MPKQTDFTFDNIGNGSSSALSPEVAKKLLLLAQLGASKDILAHFLDAYGLHRDHCRFLLGPVVQCNSPWMADTPTWLYDAIIPERLGLILDEHQCGKIGWQVGPAEITATMFPVTMDAPLSYEYTQIYLWASAQASARHYDKPLAEVWASLGGNPVTDQHIIAPGGAFHHLYRQLVADIRHKVVKAQKERERTQKSAVTAPSRSEIQPVQLSLF